MSLEQIKRELSRPEALSLIMNDLEAKHVLISWTFTFPKFRETPSRKGESSRETLLRYWDELAPDMSELARVAGRPVTRVAKLFYRLRATFLVWPDGTIAADAQGIIIGERNAYVRSLMDRRPATPEKGKKTDDGKRPDTENKKADRKSPSTKARR